MRHRAEAGMVKMVRERLPNPLRSSDFVTVHLRTLTEGKEDALAEAKQSIDRLLSSLEDWLN
jgi:hypothetical protein